MKNTSSEDHVRALAGAEPCEPWLRVMQVNMASYMYASQRASHTLFY